MDTRVVLLDRLGIILTLASVFLITPEIIVQLQKIPWFRKLFDTLTQILFEFHKFTVSSFPFLPIFSKEIGKKIITGIDKGQAPTDLWYLSFVSLSSSLMVFLTIILIFKSDLSLFVIIPLGLIAALLHVFWFGAVLYGVRFMYKEWQSDIPETEFKIVLFVECIIRAIGYVYILVPIMSMPWLFTATFSLFRLLFSSSYRRTISIFIGLTLFIVGQILQLLSTFIIYLPLILSFES